MDIDKAEVKQITQTTKRSKKLLMLTYPGKMEELFETIFDSSKSKRMGKSELAELLGNNSGILKSWKQA